ncbi:MAG TPA: nitroreductase family protein [Lachnospiraceae bacterium]|nr:nitroreductase family protein [Lachnospiraceae bacterium]
MDMYEAIWFRKSTKHYSMDALDEKMLHNIHNFISHLILLTEDVEIKYEIKTYSEARSQWGNQFGIEAPYYIVIYDKIEPGYLMNAGFFLGQLALYLTGKSVASCMINMYKGKKSNSNEKIIAALAFGKAKDSIVSQVKKPNRIPLDRLCVFKEDVSSNIKRVIKAARLAPSYMNSQPWRFIVYHNRIHIFVKRDKMIAKIFHSDQMIDVGFMLSNLLMEAENLWLSTSVCRIDSIVTKEFQNYNYVLSVLIE